MLKKAGIILAATTAGVLALSPLAFAGESQGHDADKHYGKDDKGHSRVVENDVNSGNLSNDCQFGNTTGDTNQGVFGGSSLLGVLSPVTGAVANAPIQTNLLNCTNVNVVRRHRLELEQHRHQRAAHLDRRLLQRRPSLN